MTPTLREAHAHIPAHGLEMSALDLSACKDRGEALDRVARRAGELDAAGEPGWLLGVGLRPESWSTGTGGARWPTLAELDRACPHRPCLIASFDHHSCAVNARALAQAGFSRSSPDPEGGVIVRDGAGEPTGLLLESAYVRARHAAPEPTRDQWKRFVRAAVHDLARHGFTQVHDLLSPPDLGPILAELHDEGALPVDVTLYCPWRELQAELLRARAYARPRVRLGGGKLFADGTLNAGTAWMLTPYREPVAGLTHGKPLTTPAELDEAIRACAGPGLELAVHAIGDGAVRAVLDAWERFTGGRARPGLRIEHCELIDRADVPRLAGSGAVCSVQPCHLLYDVEVLRRQMPHRLDRVLPLRELVDAGCAPGERLWFGSDTPIVRPDPADSIVAAVHRRRIEGSPGGPACEPIAPEQALTEAEAWRAFGAGGMSGGGRA